MTQTTMTIPVLRDLSTTDSRGTRHAISLDVQKEAIRIWVRKERGNLGYAGLAHAIAHILGDVWVGPWPFSRAADSLVQRMRKAGWLEKAEAGRGWRLTAAGKAAISE